MGTFFEILKKIGKIFSSKEVTNIKSPKKLSFFEGAKLCEINKTTNIINIDLNKATKLQIDRLGRLYPDLIDSGIIILKKKDYNLCKEFIDESKDIPLLKFFKNKINDEDFEALRSAVFIKNKRDKGEDISELLEQFRRRFGSRGNNICNLHGEGYFESLLKYFYSILKSKNEEDKFKEQFSEFVTGLPISYFVSYEKSQEMINKEIKEKIKKSRKYGINFLNVHGIGKENKEKIIEFEKFISPEHLKISHSKEDEDRISLKIDILKEINKEEDKTEENSEEETEKSKVEEVEE